MFRKSVKMKSMLKVFSRILDVNRRELNRLQKQVSEVKKYENKYKKYKDSEFAEETERFKNRLKKGESLEDILPEAFALVRQAAGQKLGLWAYDVQLIAAVALFEGKVAEQKTGEGKTLSAVFPLYLRALAGKGAHLVTVNDYLARRDAGWNAPVYQALGLSVSVIAGEQKSYIYDPDYSDTSHGDERLEHLKPVSRKQAYEADITYGTNNEFGFDYLRDNMVNDLSQMVQRGHYFAIIDEVDSVLIDEARTPLIISAPDTDPTDKYYKFAQVIEKLNPDTDYQIDEKARAATLTEHGITKVEKILGMKNLYEEDFEAIAHIENALKARSLYKRDQHYVVKDGEVIIVDEFTGRLMPGRRWSGGLHQAIEAKEGVKIEQESKTLATISFQNYFRMYEHLSGMTGTAATEADEFKKIYNLDVVVVPTNKPVIRKDYGDLVYKTIRGKYSALVADIEKRVRKGQPVLVGTTSIEKNETISQLLKHKKIKHNVLNAKNHEKEAQIIAEAGRPAAVTVATNMAGRGVDIVLGGAKPERSPEIADSEFQKTNEYKKWKADHKKVIKAGGLHVIGTERHESRRIDNQLRGRSGRQGDPGSTRFYLSLEDDLMRIFGGEQIKNLMDRLKMPEGQPIENALVSRVIEQAQSKVEGMNFDIRKRLVEYDDVANQQREIIYKLRRRILESDDLSQEILEKLEHRVDLILLSAWPEDAAGPNWDLLIGDLREMIPFDEVSAKTISAKLRQVKDKQKLRESLLKIVQDTYQSREKQVGADVMRKIEKFAYLGSIDNLWIDHIDHIDSLRESVTLRAYGQRDPLVEFKNEAYELFESLVERINAELSRRIFRIAVAQAPTEIPLDRARTNIDDRDNIGLTETNADTTAQTGEPLIKRTEPRNVSSSKKIGRNDPCPCGSGLKYKKCGLIGAPEHRG